MFPRSRQYRLGRVTKTAHTYLAYAAKGDPGARPALNAYGKAVTNALTAGATLADIAWAAGMHTASLTLAPAVPATLGLDDVHAVLDRADAKFAAAETQVAEVHRILDDGYSFLDRADGLTRCAEVRVAVFGTTPERGDGR